MPAARSRDRRPDRPASLTALPAALRRARPGAQSRSAVGHSVTPGHSVGRYQLSAARRRTRPRSRFVERDQISRWRPSAADPLVMHRQTWPWPLRRARLRSSAISCRPLSAVVHSVAVPIVRRRARPRPTSPAISCWLALCASRRGGRRRRRGEWRWWRR